MVHSPLDNAMIPVGGIRSGEDDDLPGFDGKTAAELLKTPIENLLISAGKGSLAFHVDNSHWIREAVSFADSDTVRYAVEVVNPGAGKIMHEYGDRSKEVSRTLYQSRDALPWSESAKAILETHAPNALRQLFGSS